MLNVLTRDYIFTTTEEFDADFIKYLQRKLRPCNTAVSPRSPNAVRLDISLDDVEGDVVAGIAAQTFDGWLFIDLLWVDETMRGYGIGRRLVQMAEEIARERGCQNARANTAQEVHFYEKLGYAVGGQMTQFPSGAMVYWLCKDLNGVEIDQYEDSDTVEKNIG